MRIKKLFDSTIRVKKRFGYYFLMFLMAIFFIAGFVHNNNIAYIAMFFIFSILFVSMIMGRVYIKKAEVFIPDIKIFANKEANITFSSPYLVDITPKKIKFSKRGYQEGEFFIKSNYPIGIATFYKKVKKRFLVYPELKGVSLKEYFGKGEDFEKLKEYEGESMKYIHWPSVAKGDIKAKKFSSGENKKSVFYYDSINGDKEMKISQLALWAYEAFRDNIEFQIVLPSVIIDSKEGFDEVFKKLALY